MNTILGKVTYATTAVATSWTKVLDANPRRKYADIINGSDEDMFIKLSSGAPVGAASGIFVAKSGFSYVIDKDNLWRGEVWAIHAGTGTKNAFTMDGE